MPRKKITDSSTYDDEAELSIFFFPRLSNLFVYLLAEELPEEALGATRVVGRRPVEPLAVSTCTVQL